MYDLDPDQERLAGCFDGIKAGTARAISEARKELARFGLSLNSEFAVQPVQGRLSIAPEPEPTPDNPLGNPHYAEGFARGILIGMKHARIRIRQAIAVHELFLTEYGTVTSIAVASDLVAFAQHEMKQEDLAVLRDDQALHAFLDRADAPTPLLLSETNASAEPASAPILTPPTAISDRSPSRSSSPTPPTRLRRAWTMVKENVNRRTAIATLLGAVTTTLVVNSLHKSDPAQAPKQSSSLETPSVPITSAPSYVPPTTWDHLQPEVRSRMLSLDELFYTFESTSNGTAILASLVRSCMLAPQELDEFKKHVSVMLASSQRDDYWGDIALGLSPTACGVDARISILANMVDRVRILGPQAIPGTVYSEVLSRYQSIPPASNPLRSIEGLLLSLGGIPH